MNDSIQPVRWGIISTANIAKAKLVPAMKASPWCDVVAVGSRSLESAKSFAEEFDIPNAYGSYEEVINDPDVEAVYIPLPNHLHVETAIRAAKAGKHILCEKPIALNATEAEVLVNTPKNVLIAEAFMVRHHPQWTKLRSLLKSGQYGEVCTAQALLSFMLDSPNDFRFKPEFGGGALYDLGCYTTMTSRFVFDSEPLRVFCAMEIDSNTNTDYLSSAILDYGNGRQATFTCSIKMAASQRLQVVTNTSMFDLPAPYVPTTSAPASILIDQSAGLDDYAPISIEVEQAEQYQCEATNFAKAVRGVTPLTFGIEDAVNQMRVIDALFASANSGTWTPVSKGVSL
jgi:predicted dehydrogenase